MLTMSRRSFMKATAAGTAATVLASCVSGIAEGASAPEQESEGRKSFAIGVSYSLSTMSPFSGDGGGRVVDNIYNAFLELRTDGIMMELAESYEQDPEDDATWILKLRKGITDSEGNPITTSDVLYSWDTSLANGSVLSIRKLASYEVIDDYTFRITAKNPFLYAPADCCRRNFIVSQKALEASEDLFATSTVATGPYTVKEGDFVADSYVTLTKVENYWNADGKAIPLRGQPADEITFRVIQEASQMVIALETGRIDIAEKMSEDNCARFMNNPDYTVADVPSAEVHFLQFNNSGNSPVSNNVKLRQAICYAIDKDALVYVAGGGGIATDYSHNMADYLPEWNEEGLYGLDIEKAKELLADSGFDTSTTLRLVHKTGGTFADTAAVIQANLRVIGINVSTQGYDSGTYGASIQNDYSLWDMRWESLSAGNSVFTGYNNAYNRQNYSEVVINRVGAYDDKLQDLIIAACSVKTSSVENEKAVHDYVYKEMCYCYPTFYIADKYVYRNSVIKKLATDMNNYVRACECELV